MVGFDYWRLPAEVLLPEDDAEDSAGQVAACVSSVPGTGPVDPSPAGESVCPLQGIVRASVPAAREASISPSVSSTLLPSNALLEEWEQVLGLDESHDQESKAYPVRLMSLPAYIRLNQSAFEALGDFAADPGSREPLLRLRLQLREMLGQLCFANELHLGVGDFGAAAPASATGDAGPAHAAPSLWRQFFSGALVEPHPVLCEGIRPVPELQSPFVILQDVPAAVEKMLMDVPAEARDSKTFRPPASMGLTSLCCGPGGLLPSFTPRQLAHNLLAACLLNRLSANLLSACARCAASLRDAGPGALPEERALAAAEVKLREAQESERQARLEEGAAEAALQSHRRGERSERTEAGCGPEADDPAHGHRLESMVGWKSSVRIQMEAELAEAQQGLRTAQEALASAQKQSRRTPWYTRWPDITPSAAAQEPIFSVRLTAKSPELVTVKEFMEAMQLGLIDRSGSGFVTKHALEAAFVSHMADSLLLCAREGLSPSEAGQEAKEMYTHIPVPDSTSTGLLEPDGSQVLRTPRPHHALLLRTEGQTFPFSVMFCCLQGRSAGFVAVGAHPLTYSTPWNPCVYGDVLWAREAQLSLSVLPVLAMLGALVMDPCLHLGPFPPVSPSGDSEVPKGIANLAMLQAVLFNDVKMWPVALPEAFRVRWEYALRSLHHLLFRHREAGEQATSTGSTLTRPSFADSVLDEVLPQVLGALHKVPNDDVAGGTGGCCTVSDRLKRMELSSLAGAPLRGVCRFHRLLRELHELWAGFDQDTGALCPGRI